MIESPKHMLRDLIKTKDWSAEEEEEEDSEKEEDQPRDFYHPWGYTIYRTCYTLESQSRWESLIEAILLGVEGTIPGLRKDETPPRSQLLLSLFRLDLRSDASLYDGLTIDDLRKVYCNPPTNCIPSPNFGRPDRVFLVADAEVLLDPYFLPQKNVALEGAPDLATSDAEAPETAQRWCYRHHGFQRFPDTEQQRLRYFGNTYKEWSETKKQWLKCVKVDYVYAEYEQRSRHDRLPFLGWFMTTTGSIAELWETLAGGDILRIVSKVEGVTCK